MSSLLILNTLRTALIISDKQGRIMWANTASEELFSTSSKRLQNYSIHELFTLAKKSEDSCKHTTKLSPVQPLITHDQWIVGTQQPILVDYCISWFDSVLDDLPDNEVGCNAGVVEELYMVEIWAKNRHHQISQEQNQQAQYNLAKNMLRSVAHEVKNPLAGIRGAGQLLIKHLQRLDVLDDKAKTYANIIISETDRLTALINQLMGMKHLTGNLATKYSAMLSMQESRNASYLANDSTIYSCKDPTKDLRSYPNSYKPLNIHKLLEHVLTLIQSQSNDLDMTVRVVRDYDLSLPEIRGDSNQLIQVFLNLTKNASEAMQCRSNKLTIESQIGGNTKETTAMYQSMNNKIDTQGYQPVLTVITRVEFSRTIGKSMHKQVARISVIDNGTGIADDFKEQIFFPLVTGRAEGTGLGLSVVHDIVTHHQGQIEVDSRYGYSAFHVYLPFF